MENEEEKKKILIIEILKRVKIRHILTLIILLVFNTYAWFIYTTKVSVGLQAHVSAWDVDIENGGCESSDSIVVVDQLYPGMEPYEKVLEVHNYGEVSAVLGYEVKSYKLMGNLFEPTNTNGVEVTREDLKNRLLNQYPFKVMISATEEPLERRTGYGTFKIRIEWPYESGNDALDTYWGETAAEYYNQHPTLPSLEINLLLSVRQQDGI